MSEKIDLQSVLDVGRLTLPDHPRVVDIKAEPYVDSLGQSELRVTVILHEKTKNRERDWPHLRPINDAIQNALVAAGEERFPYISFLKASELSAGG